MDSTNAANTLNELVLAAVQSALGVGGLHHCGANKPIGERINSELTDDFTSYGSVSANPLLSVDQFGMLPQ